MARIIDVIDHANVQPDELVWREPQGGSGDWRMGSQVIVGEGQAAVFYREGKALDVLGPGRHTLSTGNLPILSSIIGFATSGRTPFTADLYYVNLKDLPQVGWGTNPPIVLETPNKGLGVVLLITHGVIDIGVDDPNMFVQQYGANTASVYLPDIKERIQSTLLGELGSLISNSGAQSIMDANRLLGNLEGAALAMLNDKFKAMGMRIKAFEAKPFTAKNVSMEELRNYIDIEMYERVERLAIARDAANNEGLAGGLTGAGLGLGVGQQLGAAMNPGQADMQNQMQQQMMEQQRMMQQMMMNMMQQNQQQAAPAAPAPAAAPAEASGPKTRAEIQAMLDSLDEKLVSGEISEAIYNRMYAKWEARLEEASE